MARGCSAQANAVMAARNAKNRRIIPQANAFSWMAQRGEADVVHIREQFPMTGRQRKGRLRTCPTVLQSRNRNGQDLDTSIAR
jgi:hypothetical protein